MNTYAAKKINLAKIKNVDEYWKTVAQTQAHYCHGIKELREYIGGPLHWSRNRNGYAGINSNIEYVAEVVKR